MSKEYFYQYITVFLENPIMEKMSSDNEFDTYICNIPCHLFQEYKYLLCYVPSDETNEVGKKKYLSELQWLMFEAKIYKRKINCVEHFYDKDKKMNRIRLINMNNEGKFTEFYCDYPFRIILRNPVENVSPYGQYGNLISAIELYETRIYLI